MKKGKCGMKKYKMYRLEREKYRKLTVTAKIYAGREVVIFNRISIIKEKSALP